MDSQKTSGAPLTYFTMGGGGGRESEGLFVLEILAKRDFFGSVKDTDIFLGNKKHTRIFLGIVQVFHQLKSTIR